MQNNHRVLHRDDDLLPFTTSGFLNQPAKSANTGTLKRHLATGSAPTSSNATAVPSNSNVPSSNIYDHLGEATGSKQATLITSRKVATLNGHGHTSNMISYSSKLAKVTSTDDSGN